MDAGHGGRACCYMLVSLALTLVVEIFSKSKPVVLIYCCWKWGTNQLRRTGNIPILNLKVSWNFEGKLECWIYMVDGCYSAIARRLGALGKLLEMSISSGYWVSCARMLVNDFYFQTTQQGWALSNTNMQVQNKVVQGTSASMCLLLVRLAIALGLAQPSLRSDVSTYTDRTGRVMASVSERDAFSEGSGLG